jgi:hypothetical protein
MDKNSECRHCPDCDHFIRLPGAFRRWEFEQVLQGSDEYHITAAGAATDGTELFTVYYREQPVPGGVR